MFNLESVILPEKMEIPKYSNILELIEKNPDKLIRYCNEKDNLEKYFKAFYTILLYFRMNYEKEKVHDLFINQKLNKYYIEILPINYKYFSNIDLPDELILEMLKQKNLSYKNLIGILSYLPSIEKVLSTINNNCDIISNCCIKEKQKLNILEIAHPKEIDNLYKAINKIEKILNYQLKNKKEFICLQKGFPLSAGGNCLFYDPHCGCKSD